MQPGDPGDLGAFGLQVPQQQQLSPEAVQGLQQLQAALVQAHQMQHKLQEAQQRIAETQVSGQAGGGLVEVTLNGGGEILGIRIDPQVVDPNDVETLQDLVVGALTNAAENMRETVKEILGPLAAAAEQQQQPGQMPGD
ncbi:MAG: YbaB/EbfC family nucleoid-associated protein [Mycobacterium sp.]|nr:YbaB/EbfC family nucleoid-associated protein [Mycobacterium sp.]